MATTALPSTTESAYSNRITAGAASAGTSATKLWVGRVTSGIAAAFLLFDAAGKIAGIAPAVEGSAQLGYPPEVLLPLGIVLLACVALYLLPRTAVVGAVLLTGFLGGAVATHVRVLNPLFSHTLFPLYVAALIWGGLYLRDNRVRGLLLPRSAASKA